VFALVDEALRRADLGDDGKPRSPAWAEHSRAMLQALEKEPAAAGVLLNAAVTELRELRPQRGFRNPQRGQEQVRRYYLWWMLGGVAERARQLETAETLFRGSLDGVRRGGSDEAAIYEALLRVLRSAHKRDEIVALCQAGLARAEVVAPVLLYANLARAEAQLGRIDDALKHADAAVENASDANRLNAHLLRLDMLAFAERFDAAEAEGLKLLQDYAQPDEVRRIRSKLANVYSAARRFDKSEQQLRMILELDPTDAMAHNDLGYQLADLNRKLDEAERLVRRALELDRLQKRDSLEDAGDNAAYLDSLAWVLFRRGRLAEARELLERALAQPEGEGDPVVWDHFGDVCARLGQTKDAATAWVQAKKLYETEKRSLHDPRGEEVERKLKRVKTDGP
jgi:tetratricopeptide (TPR) repeat protein